MKKLLVDTSVIIDFLRREDKDKSILFALAQDKYQLYMSIVTHTELYAGKSVWESKEATKDLEAMFSGIEILPLQEEISKKAGEIKARLKINLLDAIIAATALFSGLDLATLNIKGFKKVDGIKLFKIHLVHK